MTLTLHRLDRGVITVAGQDRVAFLQGLVSNDVAQVAPGRAIHAAFLTPQGKYLEDFFIVDLGDRLAMDVTGDARRRAAFIKRLSLYRLRSKVSLADETDDWAVLALTGQGAAPAIGLAGQPGEAGPMDGGIAMVDPRLAAMGVRILAPAGKAEAIAEQLGAELADGAAYHAYRIGLGVPDGDQDMEQEKTTLLEANFDALNGISWSKGCYMGQELTARMRYRGLVKKRLMPVALSGDAPPPGADVTRDGRTVGTLRSIQGGQAIALLRLDALEEADGAPLTAGPAELTPLRPAYDPAS